MTQELLMVIIFSLCIGSFLNVIILRLPKGEGIAIKPSYCYSCKTPLKWYHNIPLFSWIFLRGKCSFCKTKISYQYPLIEFTIMFLGYSIYNLYGLNLESIMLFSSFTTLIALSMIDFKYHAVPDSLNLIAFFTAIFATTGYLDNLYNGLMFAGLFAFIRIIAEYIMEKEALGEADIIVAGTIGAILPLSQSFTALFLTSIYALIPALINKYTRVDMETPFIPFLFLGLFTTSLLNLNFYG